MIPFVDHNRIPDDEIVQVYEGFEVSSHGLEHRNVLLTSKAKLATKILEDKKNLEALFGRKVNGYAYPYGLRHQKGENILEKSGFQYARLATRAKTFSFPENPLRLPVTAWQLDKDVFSKIEAFLTEETEEEQLFILFAHGYEFDFGTKEGNWNKFEHICDKVANADNVTACSIEEALKRD